MATTWTKDTATKAVGTSVTTSTVIDIADGQSLNFRDADNNNIITFPESGTGTVVFNEQGTAMDFRVEGDNDTHTLFVDGSTDRVGINVSDPDSKLEILEATDNQLKLSYDASNATTFNTGSGGDLTIVPSGGDANVTGNLAVSGDLTITGDDLFMNTNTSGHVLVADGTNYNPVAISGDVTLNSAGAITIANDAVEQAMIADDAVGADQLASNAVVNASIASGAAIDMDKLDGDSLGTAITDFAQDDLMILSDTSDSGNLVKMTTSNFEDAIFGNVSGDATIAAGGALTIAADSVEGTMLNTNVADTSTIELSSDTLSVLKVPNALTAGDGITSAGTFDGANARTFALDLKSNGGLVIESNEAAVDLGASSITGTLAVADGGTGATSLNNLIELTTHTTGNYLASVSGTSNEIEVSGSAGEGWTATIGLPDDVTIGGNLTVTGDITSVGDDVTIADDLLLSSDGAIIKFGAGSDVMLTHIHNKGLTLSGVATPELGLVMLDADIVADDIVGSLYVQATQESGDGGLKSGSIDFIAEADYTSTANKTSFVVKLGESEAAAEKFKVQSNGYSKFGAGAGFTQFTPTYDSADTEVNFKSEGNKAFLTFGSGNITDLNLNMPKGISGSFTLVLKQDGTGSRTITNYKVFDDDGAANTTTVQWPGGSAPTLSTGANDIDILTFYWDATDGAEVCYGSAALDFS